MFDAEDFRKIIDETAAVIEQLKTAPEADIDELQLRRDSNIQALEIIGGSIQDPGLRKRAQDIIASMSRTVRFDTGEETVRRRVQDHQHQEQPDYIDRELLRNAQELKQMAVKFGETLRMDQTVVGAVSERMSKNKSEGEKNLKMLSTSHTINTSTYFFLSVILFVLTYFVIKFL